MSPRPLDAAELCALSAFAGDSRAAFRSLVRHIQARDAGLGVALLYRPSGLAGTPRLAGLSHAESAIQIEADDPFDDHAGLLALHDELSLAIAADTTAARLWQAQSTDPLALANLLRLPPALLSLPLYGDGGCELVVVLAGSGLSAESAPGWLALANGVAAFLAGALNVREARASAAQVHGELRELADVQRLLLPDRPQIRGLAYACHYQPSAQAGGDYYDLMRLSHRVMEQYPEHLPDAFGVMLADVSGHGAGAAMEAVQFDAILRTYRGTEGEGPAGALTYANRYFFSRRPRPHFLTALGFLSLPHEGQVRWCNAGHLPPLRRRDGRVERLDQGRDIPIGILREQRYENAVDESRAGDVYVFYTDGITEARDAGGREFGIDRLSAIVAGSRFQTPEALQSQILAELHAHQGGAIGTDDQTLIVLRLAG